MQFAFAKVARTTSICSMCRKVHSVESVVEPWLLLYHGKMHLAAVVEVCVFHANERCTQDRLCDTIGTTKNKDISNTISNDLL